MQGAAGGVGLTVVEIGKRLGAAVIATASGAEKTKVCADAGADHALDSRAEDLRDQIKAATGGRGVDVVYDPVGGCPVLVLDMYEHAYHMDYGAKAGGYIDAFMQGIRWDKCRQPLYPLHWGWLMLRSVTAPHRLLLSFTASLAASLLACLSASAEPPLILEAAIPLENVDGRIDHMAIDLARKRLLVAELGNGTVDVVDLVEARAIHRISGLKQPQGAAYIPQLDLVGVSSAHDGSVSFFQGEDYAAAGVISLGEDADNIRVDPTNGQLIVGYGSGGLAVIDSAARRKIRDVPLPGHPEGFQIDPASARVFVNVPDARQIAVVDGRSAKPLSAWHQKDLKANFPLALDAAGKTVASVFRSPPKLLLFDADTGSVMASVETCRDADDVFFDNGRERIYVSCGAGAVDVFQRDAEARRSGRISTAAGARTSLFVPELDRLFVAEPAGSIGATAKLLVYRPVT